MRQNRVDDGIIAQHLVETFLQLTLQGKNAFARLLGQIKERDGRLSLMKADQHPGLLRRIAVHQEHNVLDQRPAGRLIVEQPRLVVVAEEKGSQHLGDRAAEYPALIGGGVLDLLDAACGRDMPPGAVGEEDVGPFDDELQFFKIIEKAADIALIDGILEAAAGDKGADVRLLEVLAVGRIGEEGAVEEGAVFHQCAVGQSDRAALN